MADETPISWGEAESAAQQMLKQYRAVERVHAVLRAAREADEALTRLRAEVAPLEVQIAARRQALAGLETSLQGKRVEFEASLKALTEDLTAARTLADQHRAALQAEQEGLKAAITKAREDHAALVADLARQAKAARQGIDRGHAERLAGILAETEAADRERKRILDELKAVKERIAQLT